jgi:hypothetical protein
MVRSQSIYAERHDIRTSGAHLFTRRRSRPARLGSRRCPRPPRAFVRAPDEQARYRSSRPTQRWLGRQQQAPSRGLRQRGASGLRPAPRRPCASPPSGQAIDLRHDGGQFVAPADDTSRKAGCAEPSCQELSLGETVTRACGNQGVRVVSLVDGVAHFADLIERLDRCLDVERHNSDHRKLLARRRFSTLVTLPQHPDQHHRSERPMIYPLATEPPPPERPSPCPDSHGRSLGIQPGTAARYTR